MAKKGIVEKTVRAAVSAAKEVLGPSPLAKQVIAAAASQAVGIAEARAKEALPEIERAVKKAVREKVVKPVDVMLTEEQPVPAEPIKKPKRGGTKKRVARRKSTRSTAASRQQRAKTTRSRAAKATSRKSVRKTKRSRAKRR